MQATRRRDRAIPGAVVDGFAIAGAAATVLATCLIVLDHLPSRWTRGGVIDDTRTGIAKAIAPAGANLLLNDLVRVRKNSAFGLDDNESIVLETASGGDTVSLEPFYGDLNLVVNGVRSTITIGQHVRTGDPGCFVWNTSRKTSPLSLFDGEPEWSFEYRCNGRPTGSR
ncbi:MAG: hypothetical protein WDM91_02490 [Rhizomicrobium sp.]